MRPKITKSEETMSQSKLHEDGQYIMNLLKSMTERQEQEEIKAAKREEERVREAAKREEERLHEVAKREEERAREAAKREEEREREAAKRQAEFEAERKQTNIDFKAEMKQRNLEFEAEMKQRNLEFEAEMKQRNIEFEAEMKKRDLTYAKREKKREREAAKRQAKFDAEMKKRDEVAAKNKAESDAEFKKFKEKMGIYDNSIGNIVEQFFFNSFQKGDTNFFGEKFDRIEKNINGIEKDYKDEYDILLINGKSVAIVEVKTKAHINHIDRIKNKAVTFRKNFPSYKDLKVFLGFASMSFNPEIENLCKENGIVIIKTSGENLIFYDKNMKTY